MLKVQPKYKLDRKYKGPFVIKSIADTNAVIHSKDPRSEEIDVSIERLFKCGGGMSNVKPWLGQGGKLHKRRVIRKPNKEPTQLPVSSLQVPTKTRCGRQIKRPPRFSVITSDTPNGLS